MPTLILTVLLGAIIAYFATQNTENISLNFLNYTIPSIPTYIVIVGSLLVGLFLAWVISMVNGIGTSFALSGKESKIKDYKKENDEYVKQIHKLELENTRLRAENHSPAEEIK